MPTPQVPIRLDEADRKRITAIREHFSLPSNASAVRYAVQRVAEQLPPAQAPPAGRKKSRKIPGSCVDTRYTGGILLSDADDWEPRDMTRKGD